MSEEVHAARHSSRWNIQSIPGSLRHKIRSVNILVTDYHCLGSKIGKYLDKVLKHTNNYILTHFFSIGIANADKPHLTASLWLYCGAHGMRVWLPVFPREVKKDVKC